MVHIINDIDTCVSIESPLQIGEFAAGLGINRHYPKSPHPDFSPQRQNRFEFITSKNIDVIFTMNADRELPQHASLQIPHSEEPLGRKELHQRKAMTSPAVNDSKQSGCLHQIGILVAMLILTGIASPQLTADDRFDHGLRPIILASCLPCHSTEKQEGELDLEQFQTITLMEKKPDIWEAVLEQLNQNEMPPKDAAQLKPEDKRKLVVSVKKILDNIAHANAGAPGRVTMRRLSNHEYTYTLRDLTGVESLDPASEFPIDGAAGEGFTNVGDGLVMSPSLLTKYLEAAKQVAKHAVLLPEGIRFSPSTSSRDWTTETLKDIRDFYARYCDASGATAVNLQGIQLQTNTGGRLPLEQSLDALKEERIALKNGSKTIRQISQERGLSEKYLVRLWTMLHDEKPSLILDTLRARWRQGSLVATDIERWQQTLWRFASVGHIGKVNGPTGWQEPVLPLGSKNEMKLKLNPTDGEDLTLFLAASNAGDGNDGDFAVWENARLVAPGRPDLPLRDLQGLVQTLSDKREEIVSTSASCLAAANEADHQTERTDVAALAEMHDIDADLLAGWLDLLGVGTSGTVNLGEPLTTVIKPIADYHFVSGFGGANALSVIANSSDATVRVPGIMKGHSVAAHPAPTVSVGIAWQSPCTTAVNVEATIQHAHPECGNGISWTLEIRRGKTRNVLATGISQGAQQIPIGPFDEIQLLTGDALAIVIRPQEGNHSCDLTAIDLVIRDETRTWNLASDVSPNILEGNPHSDRYGNEAVWHFFGEPADQNPITGIPPGSKLAIWKQTKDANQRRNLAVQIQQLLERPPASLPADSPDRLLREQILDFNGPLLSNALTSKHSKVTANTMPSYGLAAELFGQHPTGGKIDPMDLCVAAPSLVEFNLPSEIAEGATLIVTGKLDAETGQEGSVQMQVLQTKPESLSVPAPSPEEQKTIADQWTDNNLRNIHHGQVIVNDNSQARHRFETAFADFRELFPIALCYTKIVPVDEVVTLTLFHREDEFLKRLMLDESESIALDQMWDELHFVSHDALALVDAFEQLYQFATQDASPEAFEPLREPIMNGAKIFRQQLVDAEPKHLRAVIQFAARAWRRPLQDAESSELRSLYQQFRAQGITHEQAIRMLLARVLVAPAFLYRSEKVQTGVDAAPVDDWELATRLSYFLWSSAPDDELRQLALSGELHRPEVLVAQSRRMRKETRIRRLATEFGCQWLHVRDFSTLDEKSERHFPTFLSVREAMQEEPVRFFVDLFQADGSVLSLLDADHSFMNGALAEHYGIRLESDKWQRVDGLRSLGRGGILGFASTLAKQSGASRTSPILRGHWLSEVVLGERLPKPPKDVPLLPDETPQGLTERQLIEQHSSVEACARCHERIDPFGFALEGFDAIGRKRTKDAHGLPISTLATLPDGSQIDGLAGLRTYLMEQRRDDFLKQFCRKLLGYALGRSIQLSDQPLIETMLTQLHANDYRIGTAIDLIVQSTQFRELRGQEL